MPSFTISGYQFHTPSAYAPGHVLTAGEAQALDALRAERIQQNMRSVVQSELAKLETFESLAPERLGELRQQVLDFASKFVFVEQHRQSALDREIEVIAKQRIAEIIHATKMAPELMEKFTTYRGESIEAVEERFRNDPDVRAEAQRRLDAKSAAVTLAELF